MQDRETAEALNYRGYATRKLGRVDEGIGYYLKSVALDPHYAQVREYLGEAYVIKGDVEKASEQLRGHRGDLRHRVRGIQGPREGDLRTEAELTGVTAASDGFVAVATAADIPAGTMKCVAVERRRVVIAHIEGRILRDQRHLRPPQRAAVARQAQRAHRRVPAAFRAIRHPHRQAGRRPGLGRYRRLRDPGRRTEPYTSGAEPERRA